jgi:hypothetical protein
MVVLAVLKVVLVAVSYVLLCKEFIDLRRFEADELNTWENIFSSWYQIAKKVMDKTSF